MGEEFYEVLVSLQCVVGPEKFGNVVIQFSEDAAAAGAGAWRDARKITENFAFYDIQPYCDQEIFPYTRSVTDCQ